ncbi:chemotaxis protein methyltransferase CheR [Granulicella rosea]|uniref:protein-glutamate O-methyltransferase n=1 Tax=Granulicella rosea TaxID=474952 RepID=A0A239CW61_9BACT|nr:protein-glutamate O-methyltransferase CheR [Granulicella rosea]SNS24018.1 chemotaxis protein methyltransferase CheR [Granulicella rosea]
MTMQTQTTSFGSLPTAPSIGELSTRSYSFLQTFIYAESGIVLDEDKQYLFESRLRPLVLRENLGSLDALCDRVASGRAPSLARLVVEAMTTNETLFFRDQTIFESMKTTVFAELAKAAGTRRLRIWSAASSTGQEAYSVAMSLLEAGFTPGQVEIVGTDLSDQVLERARSGKYVQFEVSRGLPISLLMKYFTKSGLDWQVKPELRTMVRFERLDLRGSYAGIGPCDLVLCRNVLIYFDATTKQQILASIARNLVPGGKLVLGCAETLIGMDHRFERKLYGQSTFYSVR